MFCNEPACIECIKKSITVDSVSLSCYSCRKDWLDDDFLKASFGASFMSKEFKKIQENKLLETEMAYLPETQPHVEFKLAQKKHKETFDLTVEPLKQQVKQLNETIKSLKEAHDSIAPKQEDFFKKTYNHPCPEENCHGLLSEWKCGLCEKQVCPECRQVLDTLDHICDENILASVKLLKTDTKNCPKCSALIHKVDGCDQMWCTQCQTAFSWTTEKVILGHIHNPHFYEWQRQNNGGVAPRVPGDCPEVNQNFQKSLDLVTGVTRKELILITFLRLKLTKESDECRFILSFHAIMKILQTKVQYFETDQENDVDRNRDLRMQFLEGKISKEIFASRLRIRDKNLRKAIDINNLFKAIIDAGNMIFFDMISNNKNVLEDIVRLKNFFNESTLILSERYSYEGPEIQEINMWRSEQKCFVLRSDQNNYYVNIFSLTLEEQKRFDTIRGQIFNRQQMANQTQYQTVSQTETQVVI